MSKTVIGPSRFDTAENRGVAYITNVKWGCLFKYEDGLIDFYVYEDLASFLRHTEQFRNWNAMEGAGRILWMSHYDRPL